MNFLHIFLFPPDRDEYEEDKRTKFIHIVAWITALAMLVFGTFNLKFNEPHTSLAMFVAAGICLVILYLNGVRRDGWAAGLLLGTVIFVAFFNLYDGQSVEEYHRSLKQNACLAKSPTRTETTQTHHFMAALWSFVKIELLKVQTNKKHYQLKAQLYFSALQVAFQELQKLQSELSQLPATA